MTKRINRTHLNSKLQTTKQQNMAQLTLQIDSPTLLENLKKVLSLMKGVRIVAVNNADTSIDLDITPNDTTLSAMNEAKSGHDAGVVHMDNIESFIASMED